MYRLKVLLEKDDKGNWINARFTAVRSGRRWHKNLLPDLDTKVLTDDNYKRSSVYKLMRGLVEVQRDLLYEEFGKKWRLAEIKHKKSLAKSAGSAMKRAGYA